MSRQTKRARGAKLSVYLPGEIVVEMREQSIRTERSVSWLIRRAWVAFHEQAKALPSQSVVRR
jgi:uncharacterized small protein (TIGR04563 family)